VLFFGTAMSITAFPVLARILTDRGMHRTRVGGLALAAASVDDVLAWGLLAVVIAVAGAGAGHHQLRLALAPVYAAVMIWVVRPALRRLGEVYQREGRLTPNVLAAVLALLLLSSSATDWMGIKFIFGAFIFGIVMPRDVPALREAILEGAGRRVRPMMMTALTAIFGLLPAALSTRIGSQTQKPLAIVVVGGMVMTLLLNRYLMPVLYSFYGHREPAAGGSGLAH